MRRGEDEGLRLLAIEQLGALAPPFARQAWENGKVEVEPDVLEWDGSLGRVHGHLVVLWLEPDLCRSVNETLTVVDALTAAFASAIAQVANNTLAELKIVPMSEGTTRSTPYRGRV
jgi:hypothetical protein